MGVKIGVNAWVWISPFTDDSVGLFDKAKAMGYDSFEIPVEDPAHFSGNKVKDALAASGIIPVACGAFGPSRDLTSDDAGPRNESLSYIKKTLKLCEKWGAKTLVGPMYSAVGKRRQVSPEQKKKEWDRAVKGLKKAGAMAADFGVTLGVEPLNRFETDLINTCEQCLALIKEVDSPAVKIHLDTFHMHIEEKSVYDAVILAGKDLAHLHVCENDRGTPGTGQIQWKNLAKAVKEIGYDGHCVVESFTPECKTIAAAAAIWRKLAPSQDELAAGGVKFLKKLLK